MQWVSYLYVVKFYPCASLNHNLLRGDSSDVKVKSNFSQTGRNASELNSHCETENTRMPRNIALLSWLSRRQLRDRPVNVLVNGEEMFMCGSELCKVIFKEGPRQIR